MFDIEKRIKELGQQSLYNSLNNATILTANSNDKNDGIQRDSNGGLTLDF